VLVGAILALWPLLISLSAAPDNEPADLQALFRRYLDEVFVMRPLDATRLGDHRFDDRLDDISPEARARWLAHCQSTLRMLRDQVDPRTLPADDRVDYAVFEKELKKSIWLARHTRPFEEDPRVYGDYINDGVYLLLAQSTLPKETNIANVIARMRQIPRILDTARQCLRKPPQVHTETAIRQNRGAIAFFEKDLLILAGESPQKPALQEAGRNVAANLKDYQKFLENDLLSRAQGNWRLGRQRFSQKLALELDAGVTAQQLLAEAESEFVRVKNEMYVMARQVWHRHFPQQALPADDKEGRNETIRQVLTQVGKEHGRPEDLTKDVKQTVSVLQQFIADHDLLRLPDPDRCQVIEMPEFQRGNSTAYMNSPPPLDPNAAGYYAVSPPPQDWDSARVRSYLEEYNRHMLQILTIHEAYPGHYVQFEYANRCPSLIRRVLASGVYVEGWAVYTEQTLLDQGYAQGDTALRLTQLKFYLRAVANAILDHHMHCTTMSDQQAMDLLVRQAFQSEGEARLKVIRAKQSSCQLSTYFAGRMAHYRLRQSIQREMGDRFQLGRYHEAVLAQGPVPVKFLPELVRNQLQLGPR
jgi:uncharacterized protein (DUF885 family)